MKLSTSDDALLQRRITAVQLGLLLALVLTVVGQQYGLPMTVFAQLPLIASSVAVTLGFEHAVRPHALRFTTAEVRRLCTTPREEIAMHTTVGAHAGRAVKPSGVRK
ncbi:MAG: hypothetical protein JWM02_1642 [Frankiales bacterium]|nr:hypothetical protein [Frankiales bacterium]